MKIEFELKGREEMQRAMRLLGEKGVTAMGAALWSEGNRIMMAAKVLTPVDTGVLVGSGMVALPTYNNDDVEVVLGFGGAASAYAEVQHEELSYAHQPPAQAKYLEQPLNEAAQDMGYRIAEELWKKLK